MNYIWLIPHFYHFSNLHHKNNADSGNKHIFCHIKIATDRPLNDAVPNFDKDKAFERRFVIVELSEPTEVAGRWDFLQAFPL